MLILSADDIRASITMREAIDAVRDGFIALSSGEATVPVRGMLKSNQNVLLTMPAQLRGADISTVKVVSVHPENPKYQIPSVNAVVLALDSTTGVPAAVLEGKTLTALRTGAASGLATDLLSRKDAHILAVIGSGVQARTQIEAICAVRDISVIRIFSPHNSETLVAELRQYYDAKIENSDNVYNCCKDADIVVAATNSQTPVLSLRDVSSGVHINGVGSFTPAMQEINSDIVCAAKVIVDHRESAWEEAGDLIIPRDAGLFSEDQIHAEIGEIATSKLPARENDHEITFFKSVGNAVQDLTVASKIISTAIQKGHGTNLQI